MKHLALAILLAIAPAAGATPQRRSEPRDGAQTQRYSIRHSQTTNKRPIASPAPHFCETCEGGASGHIRRSPAARRTFQASHPCPATESTTGACPGYVVDHILPLKRGDADDASNMQWQTIEKAKTKDRAE